MMTTNLNAKKFVEDSFLGREFWSEKQPDRELGPIEVICFRLIYKTDNQIIIFQDKCLIWRNGKDCSKLHKEHGLLWCSDNERNISMDEQNSLPNHQQSCFYQLLDCL